MPHPREVLEALQTLAQEVVSPGKTGQERRRLLESYKEYLSWAYARIAIIHDRFLNLEIKNPNASFDEVEQDLSDLDLDEGECQILWSIYSELKNRTDAKNKTLDYFAEQAQQAQLTLGSFDDDLLADLQARLFFEALTQKTPEGEVELIDFPFAVGVKFHDVTDIEGGDQERAKYVDAQCVGEGVEHFPLIVVGPLATQSTLIHEETHGLNSAIFAGLFFEELGEDLWGGDIFDETTLGELLDGIKSRNDEIILKAVETVMPRIFANAKDEVIAFFLAGNDFTTAITMLWQSRVKKGYSREDTTVYDYFASLGLFPKMFSTGHKRLLFNQLVDEFNSVLLRNVGFLRLLWGLSQFEGKQRLTQNELISFMRITPLPQWRQLARLAFSAQYEELSQLRYQMERQMSDWKQRVATLEEEYSTITTLSNLNMSYRLFRGQSKNGDGDELNQISTEGENICQKIDEVVTHVEELIGSMKDIYLRHDWFNENTLEQLDLGVRNDLIQLQGLIDKLMPYFHTTFKIQYKDKK